MDLAEYKLENKDKPLFVCLAQIVKLRALSKKEVEGLGVFLYNKHHNEAIKRGDKPHKNAYHWGA